ncbi:Uncharacterised protein [Klebsiella pneumoniae]|nr:Uncharacterised protein [Klebsiella pneumoniae]
MLNKKMFKILNIVKFQLKSWHKNKQANMMWSLAWK